MSIDPEFRITISLVVCLFLLSGCASRSAAIPVPAPFTQVPADFTHVWTKGAHPFTGASVIDIDGDGQFEIFVGGGAGQHDALLSYRNGRLVNIEHGTGLSNTSATYGSTAIDMDADGDTDLLVARENGVYLYLNDGGRFQERTIPVNLPVDSVPFTVAVSDIDHDGKCGYVDRSSPGTDVRIGEPRTDQARGHSSSEWADRNHFHATHQQEDCDQLSSDDVAIQLMEVPADSLVRIVDSHSSNQARWQLVHQRTNQRASFLVLN